MKTEFKSTIDRFINNRDLRAKNIDELQSIGFRLDPDWNVGISRGDVVLNYIDKIIIIFKDHNALLVDPIKYESGQVSFIKFTIKRNLLEEIMDYINDIS